MCQPTGSAGAQGEECGAGSVGSTCCAWRSSACGMPPQEPAPGLDPGLKLAAEGLMYICRGKNKRDERDKPSRHQIHSRLQALASLCCCWMARKRTPGAALLRHPSIHMSVALAALLQIEKQPGSSLCL